VKSDSTVTGTVFMLRSLSNNQHVLVACARLQRRRMGPLFNRFADNRPYCNDRFFRFTGHKRGMTHLINNGYIHYSLPRQCLVSLIAYDARGRSIWNYVSLQQHQGSYHVNLDRTPLATGPYFLRFAAGSYKRVFLFTSY
jgi:hypothetical protein